MADKKQAQPQQQQQGPSLQILTQYIRDFSFENPNAPESLVSGWAPPETNVQIGLQHRQVKDDAYECLVNFRIEAKNKEKDKVCFIAELSYGALVLLQNVPKENHQPAIMVEVPKQLFPFAREIIATATAQGGYPPLYLTPINFEGLYMAEMRRLQAEQGKSAAAS